MQTFPFSIALLVLCFHTTLSLGTNNRDYPKRDISVNCGSIATSAAFNGRIWIGDAQPKPASWLSIRGSSKISTLNNKLISDDPVPHETARVSSSRFSYVFHLSPGQKILRLHFNPNPYKGFKKFRDLFTVEAGPFTLLSNFSASITAHALGVNTFTKEFCISIEENQPLNIVFSPATRSSQDKTYAFINGIEIISVPEGLTYFRGADLGAQLVGQKSLVYIDNNTALEIIHRLNVKRDSFMSGDEFDMFGMEATVPKQTLTWKRPVDVGFKYLVRIHLCELGLKLAETGNMIFKVLINEMIVDTNIDIVKERDENGNLWYRDYLVVIKGRKKEGQRDLLISLQSNNEFMDGYGPLKGFEIFKLSNPDNSLASPNPLPLVMAVRDLPSWTIRNLLSVLGLRNVIATIAVTITSIVSIIVHELQKFREANPIEEETKPSARAERHCRRFSLVEIRSATQNFSNAFLIGKGGFGIVYKGLIDNGRETVAIKKLKPSSRQGKREFWTEIETLSELRHNNLVSLIGYCNEYREMILVYDYMTCGTLADHLYKYSRDSDKDFSLTWKQRLNICIGAGRGLDYLHTGHGIIHRDVKSSNILLDENFISKVSDFGLAKPEDRNKLQSHVSTKVKGTHGYIDPYYVRFSKLTTKSDTYAFGVVLLEVLCGRPAMDRRLGEDECFLTKWAQKRINKGEVDQIVDSSLIGEISANSLKVFVGIANSCLHDEPKKRPAMAQVVLQLELALEQQETRKDVVDETTLPVSTEQPTVASSESIERGSSQRVNIEQPLANKDGRKPKMYRSSRFWVWDALWKNGKVYRNEELIRNSLSGSKLPEYDFATIAAATNQFSHSNKIGQGRYNPVYKGVLPTGQMVAVKRLSLNSRTNDIFIREILSISNLQHRNIIKLLGYCIREEPLLVYEFMANGSLLTHISDEAQRRLLHWDVRFKIILGIVRGIIYLHQDSGMNIIHSGIQTSNILLDIQMNPKISNFGNALTLEDDRSEVETSRIVGTYGYMAPEYVMNGIASVMSDIYSLGIVVLKILSGSRNNQLCDDQNLVAYAWKLWIEGNILHLVDESIEGAFSEEEALRCIQVGLLCTQEDPHHRPNISSVLKMLLGEELPLETIVASFMNGYPEPESNYEHDEPKKRPAMAQVVLQLELALEQQETRKVAIPNQITNVANETTLPVSPEQPTVPSSESIERGKNQRVNTEPPPANKDGRKPKIYKLARVLVWDALTRRGKVPTFLSEICEAGSTLLEYDFATIAAATNQFSFSNEIGRGVYGSVYKGVLPTGQMVAVKRLSRYSIQGLDQFKSEILLMSNLQHHNIIKLLGYCIHEELWLVYESMENGTLNTHIFDEAQHRLLNWDVRFKIIMGIVRGIIYLHQDSGMKIIHRGITLDHILLDIQMNPKISEFGRAVTLEDNQSEVKTLKKVGTYYYMGPEYLTFGYMAPEYSMYGTASFMSDIFSLGIVVLEIVSGRRIYQLGSDQTLVEYGAFSEEEALRCIQVGLLCTQQNPHHRPTISYVLKMLLGEELSLETIVASFMNGYPEPESDSESSVATFEYDDTMQRLQIHLVCFITKWAQNRINKGEVEQIVDSSLIGEISANSLKVFVGTAESCLHDEPKKRPAISNVAIPNQKAV
ncbi:hypothetical protein RD792_016794 [Penstemon davidsonii]|uniref:Protein kinase domain-containing protein n=1 Tax=Penstemon davidsonii TaxID=160366 RepID=A0ABR0CKR5_9LAMI|nr:hypothetical protein RD792_016794 [Penstemon davidsonii]